MNDRSTIVVPLLFETLKKWSTIDEFNSNEKSIRKTKLGNLRKSAGWSKKV